MYMYTGLLRLQQIYQSLNPGNETFRVEIVKRINNASEAIEFLQKIEQLNRWSRKYVVLDCPTEMAKEIVKSHVRDVSLGKRTYHYLLSGLVSLFRQFSLYLIFFLVICNGIPHQHEHSASSSSHRVMIKFLKFPFLHFLHTRTDLKL